MNEATRAQLDDLFSTDKAAQNKAYYAVLEATEQPVDWAYEVWDPMVAALKAKDNHARSIASQVLANLAKSDPDRRILRDFDALLAVTQDERFVTARHCMQSIWKVGLAGKPQQEKLVDGLSRRFSECASEKNCTLIRYDIIQGLRNLYEQVKDERIRAKALALIETEPDLKYRKKYAGVWKGV